MRCVLGHTTVCLFLRLIRHPRAQVHAKAVADMKKALAALEAHLVSRTYMVGDAITLADIVLVA